MVSSGANTLLANALLARRTGVPNVYSGTLKGYDPRAYDCVFTVTALGIPSNHVLPLPPVPGELARPFPPAGGDRCLAVLIGGDGAGYQYSADADWRTLGSSLTELARRHDARLLLTTSRRTGAEAENCCMRRFRRSAWRTRYGGHGRPGRWCVTSWRPPAAWW
jgi:hypothetical protein